VSASVVRHCMRGSHGGLPGGVKEDSREREPLLKVYDEL